MRTAAPFVILVACAGSLGQVPSRGGATWLELSTPNFVVWTDLEKNEATEAKS